MEGSWPLLGRDDELDLVERRLARGGGVVIAGAAGVGKTRLTREALSRAGELGMATEWVSASHSAATMPFGAFAHLLPDEAGADERPELLARIAAGMAERAGGGRIALAVDDAHLLDDASAALVAYLAQTHGVSLVASLRSGEPAPDAVVNLWKDGAVHRLELRPLSPAETGVLLESALGGQVDGGAQERLWGAARGNPLFVRELVVAARAEGQLTQDHGIWTWKGGVPQAPRLAELVEHRVRRASSAERDVLATVALAEPVEIALVEAVHSPEAVAAAARTGLLEVRDELVLLVHPLYGELLRGQTPELVARDIKRRLADALEGIGAQGPDDLLRLATWRLESGAGERPDLLAPAARRAMALFDFGLAARLARAARDAGGGLDAGLTLAEALTGVGRFAETETVLAALQEETRTEEERVTVVTARAQNLFWRLLDPPAAQALIEEAALTVSSPHAQQELASARAMFLLFEGDPDGAIKIATDLADVPGRLGVEAAMTLSWALIVVGRFDESVAVIERALARLDDIPGGVPFARDWLVKSRSAADHFAGRIARGIEVAEAAYRESVERNADIGRALHAFALGWVETTTGAVADAARHQREAAAVLREFNVFGHLPGALGELAQAEALLGNVDAAAAAAAEAEASATNRMGEIMIGLGRTWAAAAAGELSRARDLARRTAEITGKLGQRTFQALALHHAVRLGDRSAAAELGRLVEGMDGDLMATCAAHAAAEATGDAAGLDDASRRFEAIGARLLAAEAAASASLAHAEAGHDAAARAAAARANALAAECGGVRTPMLARLAVSPELTSREREVAMLAAADLSSRDIAERLVVSVRTVDNHLRNVYMKLGVAGRHELAEVLRGPAV